MNKFSLLLAGTLLTLASVSFADKFYKWVDENGVTHYGANAPTGVSSAEVNTKANASSSQQDALDNLQQKRQAAAEAKKKAEKDAEEAKRIASEPDKVQAERCEEHRKNLETLTNRPTVRRQNPETGELEVIDQEQRNQMLEETRKALESCKN